MNVNPIPKIQPITVDLANLRQDPSPANDNNAQGQYIFSNYAEYNPQGILVEKPRMINYGGTICISPQHFCNCFQKTSK